MEVTRNKIKKHAVKLRKRGFSIGKIEKRLGIRRSTLSGWFKDVALTAKQKKNLLQNWKNGLVKARRKAVLWHHAQKEERLKEAQEAAAKTFARINLKNQDIFELTLAILYLAEGSKKNVETAVGSSDPLTLRFFLEGLRQIYKIDESKIRCELYLRADQNPVEMQRRWARELRLSKDHFRQINIDKRTVGSKTYPYYMGVCNIRCGNVAIQRKLVYLGEAFLKAITNQKINSGRLAQW